MLDSFTEKGMNYHGEPVFSKTKFLTDKLMLHIMVVALTIEDFDMNPTALASDMGIGPSRAIQYFKELGCTTDTGKKRKIGGTSLLLPLQLQSHD